MKFLITLLFLSAPLFALTIVLNSGKENKINYAILHLKDTQPFTCEMIPDALEKKRYLCKAKQSFGKTIETKKMKLAELSFYEKEGMFYMAIEPKVDSKLIPVEDTLYASKNIFSKAKAEAYAHWMILLQEAPLYETQNTHEGLNFPLVFEKYQKPYIGALDLNGAPISYAQSKDIGLYLDIKRNYEKENYENTVESSKRVLSTYPNSIFRNEIELYVMRAMDKLLSKEGDEKQTLAFEHEDIVFIAKNWAKEFTSDDNLPEVLMLMVKSYIKIGAKADVNYFMDILISEHAQSPYTKKAILLFADSLLNKKEKEKAMKLYLDVLYSVKDIDIASEAAIRLSDYQMDAGKMNEAKEYLHKVLNVNAEYLLKDKEATYKLAKRLYDHKLYDLAAILSDQLLEHTPKTDEHKEALLKENGDWQAKAGNVEKAYQKYEEYLATYKNGGEYVEEVKERLDELFFKRNESNETRLANYYDKLIDTYSNGIGDKALLEKAKLRYKQGAFEEVLTLEKQLIKLPESADDKPEEIIYAAAYGLALQELNTSNCQKVVSLVETYKLHIKESAQESKLFHCFMQQARYDRAEEISALHVKDTKLEERFAWSERHVNALFKLGTYQEVITLGKDLHVMASSLKRKIAMETLQDLFYAAIRLKQNEQAMSVLTKIEEQYPQTFSTVELYNEIVKIANDSKNDLLVVSSAQKILALQQHFKSHLLSPQIEFNYIEALKRLGRDKEALEVSQSLSTLPLEPREKIRALYNAGELSLKLKENEKAKSYFSECTDINETSSWKNICMENLKLF